MNGFITLLLGILLLSGLSAFYNYMHHGSIITEVPEQKSEESFYNEKVELSSHNCSQLEKELRHKHNTLVRKNYITNIMILKECKLTW